MPRTPRPCPHPGCPHLIAPGGDCADGHGQAKRRKAQQRTDATRPSAARRGYGRAHRNRFRPAVLTRHPICVECGEQPSVHADHWPLTRTELIRRGLDPNDPRYGRGLCGPCHSSKTARNDGGFGNERRASR